MSTLARPQPYSVTDQATLELIDRLLSESDGIAVTSWRHYLATHKKCFTGAALVDWILQHTGAAPEGTPTPEQRATATELGRRLFDEGVFHAVATSRGFVDSAEKHYRLQRDMTDNPSLNTTVLWRAAPRDALVVAHELNKRILTLYSQFLRDDGKAVDYTRMRASDAFRDYAAAAAELQVLALHDAPPPEDEVKALFLNLYNALIIHGHCVLGSPKTAMERSTFFTETSYDIGGLRYTLDDMEHGVLRGNRPTVGLLGRPRFGDGDARLRLSVQHVDNRVHFALNCGARSCPPIRLYTTRNLDMGLRMAATGFLNGETSVDEDAAVVTTSKILDWYKGDFGRNDVLVLHYMIGYLQEPAQSALQRLLDGDRPVRLQFAAYDWHANSAEE